MVSCGVAACHVRETIADLEAGEEVTHLQVGSAAPRPAVPGREVDVLARFYHEVRRACRAGRDVDG